MFANVHCDIIIQLQQIVGFDRGCIGKKPLILSASLLFKISTVFLKNMYHMVRLKHGLMCVSRTLKHGHNKSSILPVVFFSRVANEHCEQLQVLSYRMYWLKPLILSASLLFKVF